VTVAALFVATGGVYFDLPGVDPWDEARDARQYAGANPVVAHPPCQLWTNLTRVNFKRYGGEHNRPGNDGGCFAEALATVRRCGGVLEHPAFSWAFHDFGLPIPRVARVSGSVRSGKAPTATGHASAHGYFTAEPGPPICAGSACPARINADGSIEINQRSEKSNHLRHRWNLRQR